MEAQGVPLAQPLLGEVLQKEVMCGKRLGGSHTVASEMCMPGVLTFDEFICLAVSAYVFRDRMMQWFLSPALRSV